MKWYKHHWKINTINTILGIILFGMGLITFNPWCLVGIIPISAGWPIDYLSRNYMMRKE